MIELDLAPGLIRRRGYDTGSSFLTPDGGSGANILPMASLVITEMVDPAIDGVCPPPVGVFRAKHDAGLVLGQLGSAGVRHRHRVLAFLRDGGKLGALRINDGSHGVAGLDLDGSVLDAAVKGAAFPQRVRINAVRSADAVGDGPAVGASDVVGSGRPIVARRLGLEATFAAD